MRGGIGLIALLLGVFLMIWLFAGPTGLGGGAGTAALQAKKEITPQLNVLSGQSEDGNEMAVDTIRWRFDNNSGRQKLFVVEVKPFGAMDVRFGIHAGDQITDVGALEVGGTISSNEDVRAFLHTAYAQNWKLTVVREGQKIELPTQEHLSKVASLKLKAEQEARLAAQQQQQAVPPASTQPIEHPLGGLLEGLRGK